MSATTAASRFKDQVKGVFDQQLTGQMNDLKQLGLALSTNQAISMIRKVVADTMNFVLNSSIPIEYRVEVLDTLISWLYTFYEARDDANTIVMLHLWHLLVGRYWYSAWGPILEKRMLKGDVDYPSMPSLDLVRRMATNAAGKQIIPFGRTVCTVAFDQKLNISQFTALIQQMMAPTAPPTPPAPPASGRQGEGGKP